ncbi:MAG: hypothetical protein M3295_03325, partial [Chloroflexota bacterium]|nr:hypothetical protein [Chloroflexota bacterium]
MGCTRTGVAPSSSSEPRAGSSATAAVSAEASRPARTPRAIPTPAPLPDYVEAVVNVGIDPGYATLAYGSLWVGNHHGDSVSRVDPDTAEVVATIRVRGEPTGVAAGFDSIWTVTQVEPA